MRTPFDFRAATLAIALVTVPLAGAAAARPGMAPPASRDPAAAQLQMRRLWEDHVAWTRLVIVSTVAGLPDLEATTQRLLRNQDEIGDAIKPVFGEEAGRTLSGLLRAHIGGAAELLAAARGGDAQRVEAAKRAWYENGDQIADFLSGADPADWPSSDVRAMMRQHLDLTFQEAVDQMQGRYEQSVADYDRVHDEILHMADALAAGLARHAARRS